MKRKNLFFSINFHKPVGTKEKEIEDAYKGSYVPFINLLKENPRVKVSINFSGILYDWFKKNKPEFIDELKELIKKRQIEILTSGYFKPLFPLIPDSDKIGQIKLKNDFIKRILEATPRGIWLTNDALEHNMISQIVDAEIEFMLVNENVIPEKSKGFYVAEEQGKTIKVFPVKSRYNVASIERGAYHLRWDKDVLSELFKKVSDPDAGLSTVLFSDHVDEASPAGRVYLKSSPDFERNELFKSTTLDYVHKKMLYVSSKLESMKRAQIIGGRNETREHIIREAERHLWMGQCDVMPRNGNSASQDIIRLNSALYSHLIEAENRIDDFNRRGRVYTDLAITDFDKDGLNEALLSTKLLNVYVSPSKGGSIFELDYRPKRKNLINPERIINGISKSGFSLIDHFLDPDEGAEAFLEPELREFDDFLGQPFKLSVTRNSNEVSLRLSREGKIVAAGTETPVKLTKTISIYSGISIVNIDYEIENLSGQEAQIHFGTEFNLLLSCNNHEKNVF